MTSWPITASRRWCEVRTLLAGLLLASAVASAATAHSQPVAPVDQPAPAPPPPPANPLFPLAQAGAPVSIGGLPALPDLSGQTGSEFVLGQHDAPSAPGTAAAEAPHLYPFNNQYLLPQHLVPSAPGEGELFGVDPGQEAADITASDYLKRLYHSYQEGGLDGALLGQRPVEGVGKPLEDIPSLPPAAPQP